MDWIEAVFAVDELGTSSLTFLFAPIPSLLPLALPAFPAPLLMRGGNPPRIPPVYEDVPLPDTLSVIVSVHPS